MRTGIGPRYYGRAANCKTCYMLGYGNRTFGRNYVPAKPNSNGMRLLFNNMTFTLTSSNKGAVGTTALASRAYNKGRASARNALKADI